MVTISTRSRTRSVPFLLLLLIISACAPRSAALSLPRPPAPDATRRTLWGTGLASLPLLLRPPDATAEHILPGPTDIMFVLPRTWPTDPPFGGGGGGFRAKGVVKIAGTDYEPVDPACARRVEAYLAASVVEGSNVLTLGADAKKEEPATTEPVGEPVSDLLYVPTQTGASATMADLNAATLTLPYPDGSFDAAISSLNVDALDRPLDVFREAARVLRPGGRAVVLFSNRLFEGRDKDHAYVVGAYLQ
eukprot:CAMPEP_0194327078 /NCGR_PEP_ID=MMETSP0171-20130528/39560_1 /TAXON_ID=218684 /ORGANISM="Corethron pennatum, Strain L29A3" /LENGTH=247 /DNA_ID=CAMNT_0039086893 /DNA_START=92 /DNA_END=832 /DNA_ORIENTATION=+